jgi:hypothetical protein
MAREARLAAILRTLFEGVISNSQHPRNAAYAQGVG